MASPAHVGSITEQYVDATTTRTTEYQYDWRHRQEFVILEADDQGRVTYTQNHYDNLDQTIRVERYLENAPAADILLARQETFFDDRGRTYQTATYAVNPSTGAVGNALVSNTWYDNAGNPIKQQAPGSQAFTKTVYDSLGRVTKTYTGHDPAETLSSSSSSSSSGTSGGPFPSPGTYQDATNVTGDTILEQAETTYDPAGNVTFVLTRQRFHNATGTGELTSPSGSQPKARVTYAAMWYDEIGRPTATADYGTGGGTAPTRPDSPPASSDTVLVSTIEYNSRGEDYKTKGSDEYADRPQRQRCYRGPDGAGLRLILGDLDLPPLPASVLLSLRRRSP